jgi:hypothetical protein
LVGWAFILVGVHDAVRGVPGLRKPTPLAHWLLGGLILHDGIWLPIAFVLAWSSARIVPELLRGPVRCGVWLSAVLAVASLPVTQRWGALPDNPSIDPNHAGRALAVYVLVIWLGVGVVIARRVVRMRRSRRTAAPALAASAIDADAPAVDP